MKLKFLLLFTLFSLSLSAQEVEEIFQVVEEMPVFPGCEDRDLPADEYKKCAQEAMLQFIYGNIQYPTEAREAGIEGTVGIRFVVGADGGVQNPQIVREIGGGCGAEALRVVNSMVEQDIRWIPGKNRGEAVPVYFNLPIKYRLEQEEPVEKAPPYFMVGADTVFTEFNQAPIYGGGPEELEELLTSIPYPPGVDSCIAGTMVAQLFINRVGGLRIGDIFDYSNLGFDYQFEAIKVLNSTSGQWQAAQRGGRPVNCYVPVRLVFKPVDEACQQTALDFDRAYALAGEAEQIYAETEDAEAAIAKWNAALELLPGNIEFLLLRGQAYLEINENAKACADLQQAKEVVALADWVAQVLPLLCEFEAVKSEEETEEGQ